LPDRIERDTDQVPQINLNGPWLERAGFRPGMAINVSIMQDCLVISREKDAIDKRQDELERRLDEEEARLDSN
jgi:hypothetical protein